MSEPGRPRARTVETLAQLLEYAGQTSLGNETVFRGQANMSWKLTPALHRHIVPANHPSWAALEASLIDEFRRLGWSLVADPSQLSFGAWMAIGRHHGLPTRLLDWSDSPLVAAYFATCDELNHDGCIWVFRPDKAIALADVTSTEHADEILSGPDLVRLDPATMHPRFRAQQGLFTAMPLPAGKYAVPSFDDSIDPERLMKWIIPAKLKVSLRRGLDRLGVDAFMVYPDLDGLGQRISDRLRRDLPM